MIIIWKKTMVIFYFEQKTSSPYVLSFVNYKNVNRNVKTRSAMFAKTCYNQPIKEVFV